MNRTVSVLASSACLLVLAACGPVHRPADVQLPTERTAWHAAVDWDSAGAEAVSVLSGYLRVDTRNPGGNETDGARYLAGVLEREGIPYDIHEYAPGRGSLVARLEGSGEEAPLCLLSHIDVVPWEDEGWADTPGPLSGAVDDEGWLWGRGALDMKGMGAVELMTMVWLKRLGVPLRRDVILLAVADEEVSNAGAEYIASELWDEIGCSHMVNEGGLGVKDVFFDDQTVYAISVGEKGVLWLRMTATGEPGHGSTPREGEAPARLLDALEELRSEWEPKPEFHPALDELFFRVGEPRKGVERAVLTHPQAVRALLKGKLMDNPATRAMITNTVHITGMEGANKPNVVPGEVSALLDCRIQPGTNPIEILAELQRMFADSPWISFEVIQQFPGNHSPWDDPWFRVLSKHMAGDRDDAVAGPIVSVGYTDSITFRRLGVHAYGIVPFDVSGEDLATMHGNGERVHTTEVHSGLRKLFAATVDFVADDGGEPPPAPAAAPPWGAVEPATWPAVEPIPVEEPVDLEAELRGEGAETAE